MNAKKTRTRYLNHDQEKEKISISANGTVLKLVNKFKYLEQDYFRWTVWLGW